MLGALTYVVLDVPSPIAEQVRALRQRYDAELARLPVEITIAGSSGIGPLAADQRRDGVFAVLERIAREHLPLTMSFAEIARFPDTSVYWLKPKERKSFDAMHAAVGASGLRFLDSAHPYTPHCSVSAFAALDEARQQRLRNEAFPRDEFRLSRLSLYQRGQYGGVVQLDARWTK
jgi:2'-5' RNA ligase